MCRTFYCAHACVCVCVFILKFWRGAWTVASTGQSETQSSQIESCNTDNALVKVVLARNTEKKPRDFKQGRPRAGANYYRWEAFKASHRMRKLAWPNLCCPLQHTTKCCLLEAFYGKRWSCLLHAQEDSQTNGSTALRARPYILVSTNTQPENLWNGQLCHCFSRAIFKASHFMDY